MWHDVLDPNVDDSLRLARKARLRRELLAEAQQLNGARTCLCGVQLVVGAMPRSARQQDHLARRAVNRCCALSRRDCRASHRVDVLLKRGGAGKDKAGTGSAFSNLTLTILGQVDAYTLTILG